MPLPPRDRRARAREPLQVVFVPGLGDRMGWLVWLQRQALRSWRPLGVGTSVFRTGWSSDAELDDRVAALEDLVRQHLDRGDQVALVGASAGAGPVLAVFARRPEIAAVVLVVGKFRRPGHIPDPVLEHNEVFDESLHEVPHALERLGPEQRARILSLRSGRDGIVPDSDTVLSGAVNVRMRTVGHVPAIGSALLFQRRRIVEFARDAARRVPSTP